MIDSYVIKNQGNEYESEEEDLKMLIWSVAIIGLLRRDWLKGKKIIRRIEALGMWILRRTERISWTKKTTKEEVLRRVGETRSMLETIVRRKKNLIKHYNERGRVDEGGYGGQNGGKERARQKAYRHD